jgi:hypothetical protein
MVEMLTVQTELLPAQWQKCVPAEGARCEEYCTDTLVNTLRHLILHIVGGSQYVYFTPRADENPDG